MALVLKDRVQETTTTTGTGTLTLAGVVTGFQSFAVIGDGNTTYYTITSDTAFEVGIGTYTATGTLLSRDTILESSNSGNAVNFGAGAKLVFVTYPAERAVDTNIAQTLTNKTIDIANNTLTGVQPTLVSGTSIKTLNGGSLLGSGDITITSIAEIRAPVITSPANNATGVSLNPTIEGSAYAPLYSVDTRNYRQLQIDLTSGDFTSPVVNQQENTDNITVSTTLSLTTAFKARIRDVATTGVASSYSTNINFTTQAPSAPPAPNIGVATATNATTANVAFTAPANNGGSTITSYTATSSPAGGTGTLNQAGSGTITVTGLNPQTNYTFTVTATNGIGTSAPSAASNSITMPLPVIGEAFGGGFFAGQISTTANSVATHNLIVGSLSTAQFNGQWKTTQTTTNGAASDINGIGNTAAMITAGAAAHPCAQFCDNLVSGGFTDWYMAAKNELEICYFNLKPSTQANNTASGFNTNAVPSRPFNYGGTPIQTSALAFRTGGAQALPITFSYWSSTDFSSVDAWRQSFGIGRQYSTYGYGGKTNSRNIRAVRRVPV